MVPMQKVQIKKDDACWTPVVQKVFLHDELGVSAQSWVCQQDTHTIGLHIVPRWASRLLEIHTHQWARLGYW